MTIEASSPGDPDMQDMRKPGILESGSMSGLLSVCGAVLLLIALLQLPLSVFLQNTRPGLAFVIKAVTRDGLLISPLPGDAGRRTPLRENDIVVRIGEVDTDSASIGAYTLTDLTMSASLGDTLRVELLRGGRPFVFDIILDAPRSVMHGAIISFARYLTNAVGPLIIMLIAVIVLFKCQRSRQSSLYLLLSASISIYFLTNSSLSQAMPWWKALRPVSIYLPAVSITFFVPLLLHFLLIFPEQRVLRGSALLRNAAVYAPYVILLLLVLPLIPGLQIPEQSHTLINYVFFAGGPLIGVLILIRSWRLASAPVTRRALRAILIGILVFGLSIAASVTVGAFGEELGLPSNLAIYSQILLATVIVFSLPVSFGYAILRYGFLDVRIIFRRTTVYAAMAMMVSLFFLALYFLLETLMSGFGRMELLFVSATLTGVFVVSLSLLHGKIQRIIDEHIFRDEHRVVSSLRELARELVNTLQREILLTTLTERLSAILKTHASALSADEQGEVSLLAGYPAPIEHFAALMRNPEFRRRLSSEEIVMANAVPGVDYNSAAGVVFQIAAQNGQYVAVSLADRENGRQFSSRELDLLRTVADHAAMCWRNTALTEELKAQVRIRQEVEIAHTIQASMLPSKSPKIPGADIAAVSTPAREVGGDFFDFVTTAGGLPGIVIGDVSDKGVSAAMVMSSAISTLRFASGLNASPRSILSKANERLCVDTRSHMFVAVFLGILDTANRVLSFTNAGLPKPLLLRAGEAYEIEWSDNGHHLPLGARPETDFHEQELELESGDILLLYTDGVIESCNNFDEEFGVKRLRNAARSASDGDAEHIKQKICDELREFSGRMELHDDLTLVVMKFD